MVHFVGAGSGAVDLITVRGMNLISKADIVIYAGSLVNKDMLQYMKEGAESYDSAYLTLEEVIDLIKKAEAENKNVVRLHTGDPSLYGAIREQMDEMDELGISYDVTPGVTAAFGAAASLGLEYTLPEITQTLIITRVEGRTPVPHLEKVRELAKHKTSMAIYLSTGLLKKLEEELKSAGLDEDTPAAIVYKATWPEEERYICTVSSLEETAKKNNIKKTAIVLVGEAIRTVSKDSKAVRSKLYSPDFETEYRKINIERSI